MHAVEQTTVQTACGPQRPGAVGIRPAVEADAIPIAVAAVPRGLDATPRVTGARRADNTVRATGALVALAGAGAALPTVLAEAAHVDAAEAIALDLLFLFALLLGVG
jgi:hypothetical protein